MSACGPLKLRAIFFPRMALASSEAVACVRGADKVASHGRTFVPAQGRRPVKEWPFHQDCGIPGEIAERLSVSRIRERVRISKQAAKGIGGQIGTIDNDSSAAKRFLITIHKRTASNPHESTRQDLPIGAYDLDQPRIFPSETVPSAQLLTVPPLYSQAMHTSRQYQK